MYLGLLFLRKKDKKKYLDIDCKYDLIKYKTAILAVFLYGEDRKVIRILLIIVELLIIVKANKI